jgi:hypothetical protein
LPIDTFKKDINDFCHSGPRVIRIDFLIFHTLAPLALTGRLLIA